jgi:hypothetical protein
VNSMNSMVFDMFRRMDLWLPIGAPTYDVES